ncbi:hypothetical protein PIB30_092673 [Stylosanthes scabra]|uniref:Uncharacterized protein n=1 Tax=Stylosanthes scabra TaxID=79078 RepID=A0ABU6QVH8_9FABA|nr:hypothetical protein [Stylosanthes scabra]
MPVMDLGRLSPISGTDASNLRERNVHVSRVDCLLRAQVLSLGWLPSPRLRHQPINPVPSLMIPVHLSLRSFFGSLSTLWFVTAVTIAFVLSSRVQRVKTRHQKPPDAPSRAAKRSLVDLLRFSSRSFSSRSIYGATHRSRSCHVSFTKPSSLTRAVLINVPDHATCRHPASFPDPFG